MRALTLFVLSCTISYVYGRGLQQASPPPAYNSLAQAVAAANRSAPNLSILLQAVQAANATSALGPNATWTILAPTNAAFTTRLNESLGLTPRELLLPANRQTLVKVLSYHVIPDAALLSSNLTDGQQVNSALQGADPLTVSVTGGNVVFKGAQNNATVRVPNIRAGRDVIHVVDDVLLPAGVGQNGTNSTAVGGGAAADGTGMAPAADSGTAVGGGAAATGSAPATARSTSPGTAVGGGSAAPTGGAGAAKVPALLLASMLVFGMVL